MDTMHPAVEEVKRENTEKTPHFLGTETCGTIILGVIQEINTVVIPPQAKYSLHRSLWNWNMTTSATSFVFRQLLAVFRDDKAQTVFHDMSLALTVVA